MVSAIFDKGLIAVEHIGLLNGEVSIQMMSSFTFRPRAYLAPHHKLRYDFTHLLLLSSEFQDDKMAATVSGAFNEVSRVYGTLRLANFGSTIRFPSSPAMTQLTVAVVKAENGTEFDQDNLSGNIAAISIFSVDGRLVGSNGGDR